MSWKDLLQKDNEYIIAPWTGVGTLRLGKRAWSISKDPPELGWHKFKTEGRKAAWIEPADPDYAVLGWMAAGYLVGDRFIQDNLPWDPDPKKTLPCLVPVFLIEDGLDRFTRIKVGKYYEFGPLVYAGQQMPLGPEPDVLNAYLDRAQNVSNIRGVTPALDAAFRFESWRRSEAEKRRAELEARRLEEEARRAREERQRELIGKMGSAAARREVATFNFTEAARSALALSGAEYLDHRNAPGRGEMIVRFRFIGRRFECVCDERTLQIIDAGVCLTDEETGEKGDSYFTLESLPGVIREADDSGSLVIFRHVN